MPRNIANEILEGIQEATDYLDGKPTGTRTTTVNVPGRVDVRSIRESLALTQAEFSARFALPIDTLRKWERGVREPDAASRAYLIDPKEPEGGRGDVGGLSGGRGDGIAGAGLAGWRAPSPSRRARGKIRREQS